MIHYLKILPEYFEAVADGRKMYEVRKNDRPHPYAVGDILVLKEWNDEAGEYTGRSVTARVTHVLNDTRFVKRGYVIMGISVCRPEEEAQQC